MRLFEWQSKSLLEHQKALPGFVAYLAGIWQSRNRYGAQEEEVSEEELQEQEVQRQRFFDFTIDGKISARNYVGVVQYEGIRIEVYPKIFAGGGEDNPRKWQTNLLYWLTYCRKIRFPFSFAQVARLEFDDFLELLIYLFAHYTEEVLSRQPFQSYQRVEEETSFLKGRLSFEGYTRHNLIPGKWQHFYCSYEPFVYDNLFNRIIKYVTRRLSAISANAQNQEKLSEILFLLDGVSDVRCTGEDCDRVKLSPLYEEHRQVLEICRLYLSNQVIDLDAEDSRNFCFLVPMEYIFEDFIFGFVADKWPDLNIRSQSTDYLALSGETPVFQIRNDLYIPRQLIIDTKYKIRSGGNGLKAGVSQGDLYQMIGYSLRRACRSVLLLYPHTPSSINTPAKFQIPSDLLETPLNIEVKNVDITFENITEAERLLKERIRALHPIFKQ